MKIATGLFTGAALLLGQMAMAQVSPATAAALYLSGKYALFGVWNCEARISTTKDAQGKVTGVNLNNPGRMGAHNAYVTLTPSSPGATSGKLTFTQSTNVAGGAVKIDGNGFPWSLNHLDGTASHYSFTATTFVLGGREFFMTYGNLVGGDYKTINWLTKENIGGNADCLVASTLTKQP